MAAVEVCVAAGLGAVAVELGKAIGSSAVYDVAKFGGQSAVRLVIDHLSLPENHDAARAVRRAQLEALGSLLTEYGKAGYPEHEPDKARSMRAFVEGAKAFAADQLARCKDLRPGRDPAILETVTNTIDSALAGAPSAAGAERARRLRGVAEAAVLEELVDGARLHARERFDDPPPGFVNAFHGHTIATGGWFDRFVLHLGEKLKRDEAFKSFYAATHLALLKELLVDVGADMAALREATDAHLMALQVRAGEIAVALATMAGDLASVRAIVREARDLLRRGATLPLDLPPADFVAEGFLRFSFKNLAVPSAAARRSWQHSARSWTMLGPSPGGSRPAAAVPARAASRWSSACAGGRAGAPASSPARRATSPRRCGRGSRTGRR